MTSVRKSRRKSSSGPWVGQKANRYISENTIYKGKINDQWEFITLKTLCVKRHYKESARKATWEKYKSYI